MNDMEVQSVLVVAIGAVFPILGAILLSLRPSRASRGANRAWERAKGDGDRPEAGSIEPVRGTPQAPTHRKTAYAGQATMNWIRKRMQVEPPGRGLWTAVVRFEVYAARADPGAHELWLQAAGQRIVRWRISPAAWLEGDEPLLAVEEEPLPEHRDRSPIDFGFGVVDGDHLQSPRRLQQGLMAGQFSIQLEGVQVSGGWRFTRSGKRDSSRWVVRREPEARRSRRRKGHV